MATKMSITAEVAPMTAAGAGPSSAIANTMAKNEPDTRMPRNSMVSMSLPTASTSRRKTRSSGCQSLALDVRAATDAAARSNDT